MDSLAAQLIPLPDLPTPAEAGFAKAGHVAKSLYHIVLPLLRLCDAVRFARRRAVQGGMGPLGVVEADPFRDNPFGSETGTSLTVWPSKGALEKFWGLSQITL